MTGRGPCTGPSQVGYRTRCRDKRSSSSCFLFESSDAYSATGGPTCSQDLPFVQ